LPDGGTIPLNPPKGENALIAIATAKMLNLPWRLRPPVESVIPLEPAELVQVARQLEDRPASERSVSLFEYVLVD